MNTTIVTGKVVDEKNFPAIGVKISLGGTDKRGFVSGIPTFDIAAETDSTGSYKFGMVYPSATDVVDLNIVSNSKYDFNDGSWQFYIERNGNFEILGSSYDIEKKNWGKTNTINFQIRKVQ